MNLFVARRVQCGEPTEFIPEILSDGSHGGGENAPIHLIHPGGGCGLSLQLEADPAPFGVTIPDDKIRSAASLTLTKKHHEDLLRSGIPVAIALENGMQSMTERQVQLALKRHEPVGAGMSYPYPAPSASAGDLATALKR